MITESSRNIMRSAYNYANANTSQFADWNMKVSLLNTEYRKLYDEICSNTMDFAKTIEVPGKRMALPPDCYRIIKVESDGVPLSASSMQNETGYQVKNGVLYLYGCGRAKLTYSIVPDTLTAPDKAMLITDITNIPSDHKNYFVTENRNGTYTFTENLNHKFLGKTFEWDLDLEKHHDAYFIDDVIYDKDIEVIEEPSGEVTETQVIGSVKPYNDAFYTGETTTHTNSAYRIGTNYYNLDFTPSIKPVGVLTSESESGFFKNVNYSIEHPVYWVNGNYKNADFTSASMPEGVVDPSQTVTLGELYEISNQGVIERYCKVETSYYLVAAMSPTEFVYDDTAPVTDPDVIALIEADNPVVARYFVFVNTVRGWVKADANYYTVSSFTDTGVLVTSQELIDYLETVDFDESYFDVYTAYSEYRNVTGFTEDSVVEGDIVTDTTLILALDEVSPTNVTYRKYVEEVEQKFIWDGEDVSEFIVREGNTVVNLQMHSPYLMISYSDGTIMIYTGWKPTVWNYNVIFGHETLGEIVALKTDDTTGRGCVWHNEDDGQYYYASFVPDTVLSYPTTTLFTLMTYRLAAHLSSLLGTENEYLTKVLIPNAEAQFTSSMSYGTASVSRMNDFRRGRYVI